MPGRLIHAILSRNDVTVLKTILSTEFVMNAQATREGFRSKADRVRMARGLARHSAAGEAPARPLRVGDNARGVLMTIAFFIGMKAMILAATGADLYEARRAPFVEGGMASRIAATVMAIDPATELLSRPLARIIN